MASNDWIKMAVEKMQDQGKAKKMLKVEVESLLVSKARAADVASLASSKRDSGTKSSDGGDFGALLRLKGEASESRRRLLEAKKISEESEEKVIELENKFKKKERENNDALGHLEKSRETSSKLSEELGHARKKLVEFDSVAEECISLKESVQMAKKREIEIK